MWKRLLFLYSLLQLSFSTHNEVCAFSLGSSSLKTTGRTRTASTSAGSLSAVRQPRRNLKKRKGRERRSPSDPSSGFEGNAASDKNAYEYKPLIASKRQEAGEDFWIDPEDLRREKQRQRAIANRKAMEGEISKEKLISEVVAPYKQNWIGYISVAVIILAAIVTNFPEVLENPTISFPDLDAGGDPIPMESALKRVVKEASEAITIQ